MSIQHKGSSTNYRKDDNNKNDDLDQVKMFEARMDFCTVKYTIAKNLG